MKPKFTKGLVALIFTAATTLRAYAENGGPNVSWHAKTLGEAIWQTALFALSGVALAIIGYKLFDIFTPGQLHKEIIENRNLAAGLIGAAIIIGVCILVAAAMMG